jgi:hypothetical protein
VIFKKYFKRFFGRKEFKFGVYKEFERKKESGFNYFLMIFRR